MSNEYCALCGADLKTAGSLAPIREGVWICSHPVPRNEACLDRAIARLKLPPSKPWYGSLMRN